MSESKRLSSGIEGLDKIIYGGFLQNRTYLIMGGPGTGKTTLGLHFLDQGIKNHENTMFINLEESKEELIIDAKRFNFDIDNMYILDLTPKREYLKNEEYDVFKPEEVEQIPIINKIINKINTVKPDRLVFDGLSNLYYLYESKYKLRKSIISLIHYLADLNTTSLFITEDSTGMDNILKFIASGVINLEYNGFERKLNIIKFRGSDHLKNYHSLIINEEGIKILPNVYYKKEAKNFKSDIIKSGVKQIDKLLDGGLESNTNTIIMGPTGVGKTTLSMSFLRDAVNNGKNGIAYLFEESEMLLRERCKDINMPLTDFPINNQLILKNVSNFDFNPIEFSNIVIEDTIKHDIDIVLIDSITGYYLTFANEHYEKSDLLKHLHNLSNYLTNKNITVIMTNEMQNITGDFKASDTGISYLADNIIFLRYIEMSGKLNKAIGVLKKRMSGFEKTIREFEITKKGLVVGKPLNNVKGILKNDLEFLDL